MRRLVLTLLAAFSLIGGSVEVASARDLALVIGNDAYRNVAPLNTAGSDATAVGDALERLGFVVRRALDVDRPAMSRALATFDGDLQPGDQAFFFYAGHGLEISGANYLLPTDVPAARINESELVRDAAFPVERIIDGIRARGTRVTILVLDACRDNPFAAANSRSAAVTGGLARVDAPEGVFVLMSAGAKQEALDRLSAADPVANSVFTRTFLREIARPGLTLVQIAKATQVAVKNLAATVGYEQTPAYYDQVIGDVVLSRASAGTPVPATAPTPPAASNDAAAVAEAVPTTRQQVASLPPTSERPQVSARAPIMGFTRSSVGWTATVSLPEPALALSYRVGDAGAFVSTGLGDTLDQRTGERQPNLSFPLAATTPSTVIQLRYTTADGGAVGPFAIRFDPEAMLFRQQKQALEMLASKWVSFDATGSRVLFTTLVVYRCAIAEVRYGLGDAAPLARYDLPGCNPRDPFSVPSAAGLMLAVPPGTPAINLQITWRDGTQSAVSTILKD